MLTQPAYARRVSSVTLDRVSSPRGELVLRRDGEHCEIVSNGVFLMDTRDGRSERELVRAAVARRAGPLRVLLGGLGVGFSLAEALAASAVGAVTVVEVEAAVVAWHRTHLAPYSAGGLDDPRVTVVVADLLAWLGAGTEEYDAVCLDVDNGPEWTVTPGNAALYGDTGLDAVDRRLAPGGTLAVWSAAEAPAFAVRLRDRWSTVDTRLVPVRRGGPDVIYLARGRRAAPAAGPAPAVGPAPAAGPATAAVPALAGGPAPGSASSPAGPTPTTGS